jgi:hypothetical protein
VQQGKLITWVSEKRQKMVGNSATKSMTGQIKEKMENLKFQNHQQTNCEEQKQQEQKQDEDQQMRGNKIVSTLNQLLLPSLTCTDKARQQVEQKQNLAGIVHSQSQSLAPEKAYEQYSKENPSRADKAKARKAQRKKNKRKEEQELNHKFRQDIMDSQMLTDSQRFGKEGDLEKAYEQYDQEQLRMKQEREHQKRQKKLLRDKERNRNKRKAKKEESRLRKEKEEEDLRIKLQEEEELEEEKRIAEEKVKVAQLEKQLHEWRRKIEEEIERERIILLRMKEERKKEGYGMLLYVNGRGREYKLHVMGCEDDIADVRAALQATEGMLPEQLRIIFAGQHLEDGHTLREYNVQKESTLHVICKLRGGGGDGRYLGSYVIESVPKSGEKDFVDEAIGLETEIKITFKELFNEKISVVDVANAIKVI